MVAKSDLPSFLAAALPITAADRAWFAQNITGWTRVHEMLPKLSERQLLVAIVLEMEGSRRPEIISRCLRRFHRVRAERELNEFWRVAPKAGVRGGRLA